MGWWGSVFLGVQAGGGRAGAGSGGIFAGGLNNGREIGSGRCRALKMDVEWRGLY